MVPRISFLVDPSKLKVSGANKYFGEVDEMALPLNDDYEAWASTFYDALPLSGLSLDDVIVKCMCEVDLDQTDFVGDLGSSVTKNFSGEAHVILRMAIKR